MNRADLLHSVLKDGREHTRREIFEQVGYMLTNNAASELRARGHNVQHTRKGRVDAYQLVSNREMGVDANGQPRPEAERPSLPADVGSVRPSSPVQLAIGEAA